MEVKLEKKPARGGLLENGGMEMLDYVEARADQTMAVLRQSYDDLHERAYKLATVLVAGGGAAGVYAMGKMGAPDAAVFTWAPIAALALSWFGTASILVWDGATSKELSAGIGPRTLIENYDWRIEHGEPADAAVAGMRRQEMELQQVRIGAYSSGCISRAEAIDRAYKTAAICTPLVPALVALVCYLGR